MTVSALDDLEVEAGDIMKAYLKAPITENYGLSLAKNGVLMLVRKQ